MKTKKWSPVKEILFIYLAVNKIGYWFNTITGMEEFSLTGGGEIILNRLLNQDLVVISVIILMYYMDKRIELRNTKYGIVVEHAIIYGIGYVAMIGMIFVINSFTVLAEGYSWGEYIRLFLGFMPTAGFSYVVIIAALEVKLYLKKRVQKASEEPVATQEAEDKLNMLKVLLEDGILNQEEFEEKKEKLLCTSTIS